jgi:uncharacterized membrane protein YdjX (TVP38/TMEM64 family)
MIQTLQTFLIDYPIIAPIVFIFIRILPVVIPPIPGLLVDAVGVVVFGWFYGFIYAAIGVVIASMIAFFIGRRFREPLLSRFISIQKIHELEDKLSDKQKFWALVGIRFISSPFFDIINYVAGLTKIKAMHYFFSSIIVTIPMSFMIYYFGGIVLNAPLILISTLIIIIPFMIWYKKKKVNVSDML